MRYKLTIAYDGTDYCGWQVQDNSPSIQQLIQQAIETVLRHPIQLTGSGRTDAGVHARGQVAHFDSDITIQPDKFHYSLNALLPDSIRILEVETTHLSFHARYSAKSKTYHYHITQLPDPFAMKYRTHIPHSLDLELLHSACQALLGTHDFSSFANEADRGSASRDPIRTLTHFAVIPEPTGFRFELEADGFLYKMVRNLVGTVLDVARGRLPLTDLPHILAAKDRSRASAAAPPHGLFLIQVTY
jgi:tRNA pseudouridine38-40 synthase